MKQVLKKGICYIGLLAVLISIVPMGHGNEALAGQSYQSAIDKAKKEKEELEKKRKEAADRIAALEADKKSTEEYIQKVDEELSVSRCARMLWMRPNWSWMRRRLQKKISMPP